MGRVSMRIICVASESHKAYLLYNTLMGLESCIWPRKEPVTPGFGKQLYGLRTEESARRKVYSTVSHSATGSPFFIAGLNLISQAARIALSVSPKGSRRTTLTRSMSPFDESRTFRTT